MNRVPTRCTCTWEIGAFESRLNLTWTWTAVVIAWVAVITSFICILFRISTNYSALLVKNFIVLLTLSANPSLLSWVIRFTRSTSISSALKYQYWVKSAKIDVVILFLVTNSPVVINKVILPKINWWICFHKLSWSRNVWEKIEPIRKWILRKVKIWGASLGAWSFD